MDQYVLVPSRRLLPAELNRFKNTPFENMIKFAADLFL